MAKILITGGYGYLGSRLAVFFKKNHIVSVTYNSNNKALSSHFKKSKIRQIKLDVTNFNECKKKIKKFDFIIHLAALDEIKSPINYKNTLMVNTVGTKNILEACKINKIKNFIYFSTVHIYGNINELKYLSEKNIPNPLNDYSLTHYFAEKYIVSENKKNNINGLILRLSNGYGYPINKSINRWSLIFNDSCKQIFDKQVMIFKTNGKVFRNFISITDITLFLDKIIKNPYVNNKFYKLNSIEYNLVSKKSLSIYNLSKFIKKIYEKKFNKKVTISINKSDKRKYNNCFISNKKIKKIGFTEGKYLNEEILNTFKILSS